MSIMLLSKIVKPATSKNGKKRASIRRARFGFGFG